MTSHIQTRGHWRQYWKSVPLASMVALGVAVFLTFSSLVFVSDLVEPRPSPYWWVLVYAADMGIVATGYALASTRFIRLLPLAVAVHLLTIFGLTRVLPLYSRKVASGTTVVELHGRHILDAWLVVGLVTLGYAVFFNFISTEGKNYVRLRTEIELAERVQARLVPAFEMTAARLAICGKSVPSSSVGGDLVDAVAFDGSVTCYLADVSGHGIAAGVLMSMVKSAVRTSLSKGEPLVDVMQRLNEVLLDLKEPAMYITFACLRSAGGDRLEYSLAGHPPILHYHASNQSVSELKMEQLPIAMFPAVNFQSAMITIAPGDLLAVVSDGFLEVTNANGEEFGRGALERLVAGSATEPLPQIIDRLVAETARFGSQQDDQTILLVRALGPAVS
ncbi:MAG: PP2C family protein-serine/threonine phosphatase [Candidatus Sulfotelmatobacter sp.]